MNVTSILLTLLLVLELLEAQYITSCNITADSISYNSILCTPKHCYSQEIIDQLNMCRFSINNSSTPPPNETLECRDITIEITSSSTPSSSHTTSPICTATSTSSQQLYTSSATDVQAALGALGALVGLLMVLLTLALFGWVWTCVILKKKGTVNINKSKTR